jgi:hypothetical protein
VDFPKGALVSVLLAGLVLASVWAPELGHWYVRPPLTTALVLETMRKEPAQSVLEEVAAMRLGAVVVPVRQIVPTAERVMRGTLALPGFPPTPITLPFAADDLESGLPTFQLMVASLAPADILLDAYRMTRREEFFRQARDVIVGFSQYEAAQWVDRGLMWNDHAASARVPVLAKFWAEYRTHPEFDPRVARIVLNLVARSAHLLAKPSFYAWRTSHGILTDLAILQIAVAFPDLAEIAELRNIAARRFRNHLDYWINEEGVTLLHSAGYHAGSLYHFGLALRLHTLNDINIPEEWWRRYTKAGDFFSLLRRPDGTLPMYGDTSSTPSESEPALTRRRHSDGAAEPLSERVPSLPSRAFSVYPVAGNAILWDGLSKEDAADPSATQTVITWSYHPGLGHKVADELSMLLWARGRTWLTNTGYWPYGVKGRGNAESWEASNAPHLLGESKHSERTSRVRSVGQGEGIALVDMERSGPSDYAVRRQIVRLGVDESWIVLDYSRDTATQTATTNWTFYPDLRVTSLATEGSYRVSAPNSTLEMLCSFSGSEGLSTEATAGSERPFAGWVVLDRTPTQAPAIVVRQPSRESWGLALFSLVDAGHAAAVSHSARMAKWIDVEHWTVFMATAKGDVTITRSGDRLAVHRRTTPGDGAAIQLAARAAPDAEIGAVRNAYRSASETFSKFPELVSYRTKVSYFLLVVLGVQELVLHFMGRRLSRAARGLRVASWIGWTTGGLWLWLVYFTVTPVSMLAKTQFATGNAF